MTNDTPRTDSLTIAHSTVSSEGITYLLQKHYEIRQISECHLIQSGYNDVYVFECTDQSRWIARLSGIRPRGPANIEYEVSLLDHLNTKGVSVANAIRTRTGDTGIEVELPEGPRCLTVFHFVKGDNPGSLDDWQLTGSGLARIHNASDSYNGPASLYQLDINHLLRSPMKWLLNVPKLDDSLRDLLNKLAADMEFDFNALGDLNWTACHGDCHGGNNYIYAGSSSKREAVFFDFDDSGPGYLAYDLAVFLWSQLEDNKSLSEKGSSNWKQFLNGYESERELAVVDREALPVLVRIRHILWLGEHAGRCDQWGLSALPKPWLRKQAELLEHWRKQL